MSPLISKVENAAGVDLGLDSQLFFSRSDAKSKDEMLFLKAYPRSRTTKAILLFSVLCCVWIFTPSQLPASFFQRDDVSDDGIAASSTNSTLGFGEIYVISQQGSPRQKTIVQAANVTELQLSIPTQPIWTEDDENAFRLAQDSTILSGSLLAWLGHLHVLRQ